MPVRDWDKHRRYDRARPRSSAIDSFRPRKKWKYRGAGRRKTNWIPGPLIKIATNMEKTLRCSGAGFAAGAVFQRVDNEWRVKRAAPILAWMKGREMGAIKAELLRRGISWRWI